MAIFHPSRTTGHTDVQVLRRSGNTWAVYVGARPLPIVVLSRWRWLAAAKAKNLLNGFAQQVAPSDDSWDSTLFEELTPEQLDRIWLMLQEEM